MTKKSFLICIAGATLYRQVLWAIRELKSFRDLLSANSLWLKVVKKWAKGFG